MGVRVDAQERHSDRSEMMNMDRIMRNAVDRFLMEYDALRGKYRLRFTDGDTSELYVVDELTGKDICIVRFESSINSIMPIC